ncbi:hypothetical protein SUGI_0333640 [Cryptomeria japonica]|uniref:F-box protein At5g51370 n=1 Tax=Cryptomeria japonica TaxID=3369 RepID=UPI002408D220|nr:F-box protein At5g51370 [Cryptomeria japonica]GLJ18705.1 hypothetical protein SUGI_0333640 [Cryptomeria japonica]
MTPVKTPFFEDKTNQNAAIAWLRFKNVLGLMQLKGMVDKQNLLSSKGQIEGGGGGGGGGKRDLTLLLSDEILLRIVDKLLSEESSLCSFSVVCHRWLRLQGLRRHSIKLQDWDFLAQGRMISRFPNLTDVDLTRACILAPQNACIVLTHGSLTIPLDGSEDSFDGWEDRLLDPSSYDRGLQLLAQGCPGLQKLSVIDVTTDVSLGDSNSEPKGLHAGLARIAHNCTMLQELELYRCTDESLRAISVCKNLQILRLVGSADGVFHRGIISDIGLTILARGCSRLVKLELSGCQGSYDGIAAIGRCCFMLEELTLSNHNLDEGWIASLSFCNNLKTLRLQGCRRIDSNPGPVEHLGCCPALETLQLQRCNMSDRQGSAALMLVCSAAKELEFQYCWGLDDDIFSLVMNCRRIKYLSLEGCSLLTTGGLEAVVLVWKDLQHLQVVSCNNIRDAEITPSLASLFSVLKELKWRPDTKSVLSASLTGTGMGQKRGRFFKK